MGLSANDVVPFTMSHATLSKLADQANAGAEKSITNNGESYVALIHLLLIADAQRGLADIEAGRTHEADDAIGRIQMRRALAVRLLPSAKPFGKRG